MGVEISLVKQERVFMTSFSNARLRNLWLEDGEIQSYQYLTLNVQHLYVSFRQQSRPALSHNILAKEGSLKCAFNGLRLNSEWE